MQQVQVQLNGLPITLVLLSNGCVVFVPIAAFSAIVESGFEVNAWFFPDEFFLMDNKTHSVEDFSYNVMYDYKIYPSMLSWLKQQELQSPFA